MQLHTATSTQMKGEVKGQRKSEGWYPGELPPRAEQSTKRTHLCLDRFLSVGGLAIQVLTVIYWRHNISLGYRMYPRCYWTTQACFTRTVCGMQGTFVCCTGGKHKRVFRWYCITLARWFIYTSLEKNTLLRKVSNFKGEISGTWAIPDRSLQAKEVRLVVSSDLLDRKIDNFGTKLPWHRS